MKSRKMGRRRKQKIPLRMHQYRIMKVLKMMKSLLKKLKARNVHLHPNSLKKLMKLRKWMDHLNPVIKLNMNMKET